MSKLINAKNELLDLVGRLNYKYELSKTFSDDYFEPGMMENLEQYMGIYDKINNVIMLRTEAKGLRYDNRTQNLEKLTVGDDVQIIREESNVFNSNNFMIKNKNDSLGNLSAELCNALAPIYDAGYAVIQSSKISYLEKIKDRSRYAKQGILFVEIAISLRGL